MTADLRQGVTPAVHAVLDRADEWRTAIAGSDKNNPASYHLQAASRAAASALRADPQNGMGRRRVTQAIEAAALLIVALEMMDEGGRDVQP